MTQKVLDEAEKYYKECRKRMELEKPLGTKEEGGWEIKDNKNKKQYKEKKRTEGQWRHMRG